MDVLGWMEALTDIRIFACLDGWMNWWMDIWMFPKLYGFLGKVVCKPEWMD